MSLTINEPQYAHPFDVFLATPVEELATINQAAVEHALRELGIQDEPIVIQPVSTAFWGSTAGQAVAPNVDPYGNPTDRPSWEVSVLMNRTGTWRIDYTMWHELAHVQDVVRQANLSGKTQTEVWTDAIALYYGDADQANNLTVEEHNELPPERYANAVADRYAKTYPLTEPPRKGDHDV